MSIGTKPSTAAKPSTPAASPTPKPASTTVPKSAPSTKPLTASIHKDSFSAAAGTGHTAAATAAKLGSTTRVAQAGTPGAAPTIDDVVDALKGGKTDEATRTMIATYFTPLSMAESTAAMDRIRAEGLVEELVDATARDVNGDPVTAEVKTALVEIMSSGRLDVYAETLATVPISVGNYGSNVLQFDPNPPKGVELDQATLAGLSATDVRNVLAHEIFHAFSDAHGGDLYSALDEGFGIAVREYAFTDAPYNVAEMVYGTYKNYRDIGGVTTYPMGDYGGADPKLTELMNALSSRDSSQIAWNNPTQLQSDYDTFFAGLNRNQDFNTWKAEADQAAADMVAARTANPAPAAPPPSNPVQQFWDWLTGLFGG